MVVSMLSLLFSAGCDQPDQPIDVWGGTGRSTGEMIYPRAIAFDPVSKTFVVVDRTARIQRLDPEGNFINGWRMPDLQNGKPVGISVSPEGDIWVPDTHYNRILVYDTLGSIKLQFGRRGTGPAEFELPTDVAFGNDGDVYVGEYGGNDRIQVFDRQGNFRRAFGKLGSGPGEFSRPQSLVFVDNELFVVDACNHRVQVFSPAGEFKRQIGSVGREPGQFRFPYGLDLDADGNLIVTEYGGSRVQRIDRKTGRPFNQFGTPGRRPGEFAYPWAACIDNQQRIVVVDSGNNRLQVFDGQ
jgi:DNA-binding beta-propeller fold protein YncE